MLHESYPHAFKLDKPIRIATDAIPTYIPQSEYTPNPPPMLNFFLLLNGGHFLLLNGQDLTLL